jgi:hypothetical protein
LLRASVIILPAPSIRFRTLINNWDKEKGFSIKSTWLGGNSLKFDASRLAHQILGVPEMNRTGMFGYSEININAICVPENLGSSMSLINRDIGPKVFAFSIA